MPAAQVFFLLIGAVAVGSALAVVLAANTVHAALFLLLNLFSVAVLYLTLSLDFLFAVQIIVYAGAILVLFMFVITLLNPATESALLGMRGRAIPTLALSAALLVEGLLVLRYTHLPAKANGPHIGIAEVGTALFTTYLFPFEVVSVLLLVAVVGAMVLARYRLPGARTRWDEPEGEVVVAEDVEEGVAV